MNMMGFFQSRSINKLIKMYAEYLILLYMMNTTLCMLTNKAFQFSVCLRLLKLYLVDITAMYINRMLHATYMTKWTFKMIVDAHIAIIVNQK